ncbi:MAG: metalloregulator ArsR/SmtB family transcription factor [Anaerolineales bacterium]
MLDSPRQPLPVRVIVDITPTINALHSLTAVADAPNSPGIGEWAVETYEKFSPEEREIIQILTKWIGTDALINAIPDGEARASFPAYLDELSAFQATQLRDVLLKWMSARPSACVNYKPCRKVDNPDTLLASREAFLTHFVNQEKTEEDTRIANRVYDLLTDPPALQAFLYEFLRRYWDTYLKDEWSHHLPELEAAVDAFKQLDLSGLSHFEVIETITRRNFRGIFRPDALQDYAVMRFIPSPHCGPYILKTGDEEELQISFGAYHLSERTSGVTMMDSTQMVERLKALGDETRLEIIRLLKREGEVGTQEIIDRFKLSKSAASRHMRQLTANGIVDARVDEDGLSKFYRLNPAFMPQMQEMLGTLVG